MSAPTTMPDGSQPGSGQTRQPLVERLIELLPSPLSERNKEGLAKVAAGVRSTIEVELRKKKADDEMVSGFKILEPDLKFMRNVCKAHCVIGEEIGRADGQPVRRILDGPKQKHVALPTVPEEESDPSGEGESSTAPQLIPLAATARIPRGRKVNWDQETLSDDGFIGRAVEEAGLRFPGQGTEVDAQAAEFVSRLIRRLNVDPRRLVSRLGLDRGE